MVSMVPSVGPSLWIPLWCQRVFVHVSPMPCKFYIMHSIRLGWSVNCVSCCSWSMRRSSRYLTSSRSSVLKQQTFYSQTFLWMSSPSGSGSAFSLLFGLWIPTHQPWSAWPPISATCAPQYRLFRNSWAEILYKSDAHQHLKCVVLLYEL